MAAVGSVCYGSPPNAVAFHPTDRWRHALPRFSAELMNDSPRALNSTKCPPKPRGFALLALAALLLVPAAGCQMWPWRSKERTTVITPSMRAASIREMGPRGREGDADEQARISQQLAQQIRIESDPIVRKAIQETISEFETPLASSVILAGLNDDDRDVRVTCCRLLGERKNEAAITPLSKLVATDADLDVRLAAVDALGAMKTKASVAGLAAALKDRDPAMQYAGVQAMQNVSDEDFGNDVEAWRQYASQVSGGGENPTAVASQPDGETTIK